MGRRAAALAASWGCLALAGCGGGTGSTTASETERVADVIRAAVTTTDPSICDRLLTDELVMKLGGAARCREAIAGNTATSVQVERIQVSPSGGHATALVIPQDGDEAGARYSDTLTSHGGEWRIDAIRRLGP